MYPQSLCINVDLGELVIVIILDEIREDILFLGLSEACQNRLSLLLLVVFVIIFTLFSRCGGLRFSFTFPFLLVLFTSFLVFSFTTNGSLDTTFRNLILLRSLIVRQFIKMNIAYCNGQHQLVGRYCINKFL